VKGLTGGPVESRVRRWIPACTYLLYNILMLVMVFLQWWYGPGWRDAGLRLSEKLHETYLWFSIPILLRTLFAPWRRITTPPGGSLEQRFRAGIDNLLSRVIGFIVRLIAIGAALGLMAFWGIFGGLLLLLWPAIPLAGPALIVAGLL
jgi:hypothetical protein